MQFIRLVGYVRRATEAAIVASVAGRIVTATFATLWATFRVRAQAVIKARQIDRNPAVRSRSSRSAIPAVNSGAARAPMPSGEGPAKGTHATAETRVGVAGPGGGSFLRRTRSARARRQSRAKTRNCRRKTRYAALAYRSAMHNSSAMHNNCDVTWNTSRGPGHTQSGRGALGPPRRRGAGERRDELALLICRIAKCSREELPSPDVAPL